MSRKLVGALTNFGSNNMAKKQTRTEGKRMPAVTEGATLKLIRLELTPEVQQEFRVEAAKEGISMAAMARRLVEEWLTKRRGGKK
jgi:hypothetical protein